MLRTKLENTLRVLPLLVLIAVALALQTKTTVVAQPAQYSGGINIFGLVDNPINLTDADLLSLPMVSEVATIHCVWENAPGSPPTITVNWTGVPLFHLLTMAEARPEAFKVVFRARPPDDFFDTLKIEDAIDPHVILAVEANDTLLTTVSEFYRGHKGGYRMVVPGRWGYKWVANVGSIEVVDSNILGTYETNLNQPDDALVPNALPTSISPPLQVFNSTFGNRTFQLGVFTNASIDGFEFNNLQNEISLNVSAPPHVMGFADFIVQQDMLKGPYSILVDGKNTAFVEANVTGRSFQFLVFPEGNHAISILGAESSYRIPTIVIEPINQPVRVGEIVIMNASRSVDIGVIVSYAWDFGDGTSGAGAIVSNTYAKEGRYQVSLNVTDNEGFSNVKTFQVAVESVPLNIALIIWAGLLVFTVLLAFAFAYLVLTRRKGKDKTKTWAATGSPR
ncbi:PKD domain-containing protein [Candidatus Bathyarchaeota archaeon]|nr:PKD domain-containing protein [Candidatus Bathyarchaeota archaeon]